MLKLDFSIPMSVPVPMPKPVPMLAPTTEPVPMPMPAPAILRCRFRCRFRFQFLKKFDADASIGIGQLSWASDPWKKTVLVYFSSVFFRKINSAYRFRCCIFFINGSGFFFPWVWFGFQPFLNFRWVRISVRFGFPGTRNPGSVCLLRFGSVRYAIPVYFSFSGHI